MNGGLYELSVISPGPSVGTSTLRCESQGPGGSHKSAWRLLSAEIDVLQKTGGLDMHSLNVLSSTKSLISSPRHVSAFRNSVNYSLDIAGGSVTPWASCVRRLNDASELEAEISVSGSPRDENRVELLLLAALSWLRSIYADYLDRAPHPDRRRGRARAGQSAADPTDVAEWVGCWV